MSSYPNKRSGQDPKQTVRDNVHRQHNRRKIHQPDEARRSKSQSDILEALEDSGRLDPSKNQKDSGSRTLFEN